MARQNRLVDFGRELWSNSDVADIAAWPETEWAKLVTNAVYIVQLNQAMSMDSLTA